MLLSYLSVSFVGSLKHFICFLITEKRFDFVVIFLVIHDNRTISLISGDDRWRFVLMEVIECLNFGWRNVSWRMTGAC